jgi:hypothetical protein
VFVREFDRPTYQTLMGILRDLAPAEVPERRLQLIAGSVAGQCHYYHTARHILPLLLGPEQAQLKREQVAEHIWSFTVAALRELFGAQGEVSRDLDRVEDARR